LAENDLSQKSLGELLREQADAHDEAKDHARADRLRVEAGRVDAGIPADDADDKPESVGRVVQRILEEFGVRAALDH
jgi:hypothetical protein